MIGCIATPKYSKFSHLSQRTEMVNIEIPKHYTTSPSSFNGTPHLTINHDATVDLDSTNAFEGRFAHSLHQNIPDFDKGQRNF